MADYLRYYLGPLFMVAGVTGFALGGSWTWLGTSTFAIAVLLDLCALRSDYRKRTIRYPRVAQIPLYLHAVLLPALVIAAAYRIHLSSTGIAPLGPGGLAGCVVTVAWLGVMPNVPVLHELIHRRSRFDRFLGFLLAVTIADPLRRLAHLRGHHVQLGLEADPDTARRGESIYAFVLRASVGATREALLSERSRLAKLGASVWSWRSDAVRSLALTFVVLALVGVFAGPLAALLIGTSFAISRLLLESFNYLQHYGIVRVPGTRYERRHTWSHLTPVVRVVAFEITNHAHHHMNPQVPFYALEPDPTAPEMPSALLCFLAALIPPLWVRWIAKPKLEHWDHAYATPEERALAAAANEAAGWPAWSSTVREGGAMHPSSTTAP